MGGKESLPAEWVVNIERVDTDSSAETQARAKAPEHNNETEKEEEKPRDIDDANKSIQNQTDILCVTSYISLWDTYISLWDTCRPGLGLL